MKKYTTINHAAQRALELSLVEYCLADLIHGLSANPKNQKAGWCYASRESMARMLGLTKRGVVGMIDRLIEQGIVEKDPETKYLKATAKWYEAAIAAQNPEQSSGNVVHRPGEPASPDPGNVVHRDLIEGKDLRELITSEGDSKPIEDQVDLWTKSLIARPRKDHGDLICRFFEGVFDLQMPQRYLQRKYAVELTRKNGIRRTLEMIVAAQAARGREFFPKILDLKSLDLKWNDLEDAYRRHQTKEAPEEVPSI